MPPCQTPFQKQKQMSSMNCLIWNCRGIKKTGASTFLRDLILEHRFHFVGLQETMQADIEDNILREIDPFTLLPLEMGPLQR